MKKKFKIFFLEPNYEQKEKPGFDEFMEPLGLAYIARAAYEDGHSIKIMQQFDASIDEIVETILDFNPDILALSFVTKYFYNAVEINKLVKKRKKDIISIVGGAHSTGYPKITAKYFDYIVLGEGENTFLNLLSAFSDKRKPNFEGTAFFNENGDFINKGKPFRQNFIHKFPYRDGLDFSKYTGLGNGPPPMPKVGFASLLFTKGCRFNCFFCQNANIWLEPGKKKVKVVSRTATDVVEEMRILKQLGVDYLWFQDPDFPLYNHELMHEFFDLKKKFVPDIKISFMTRIDNIFKGNNIDEATKILAELKEAGGHMIGMGIESSNKLIMKGEKKFFKRDVVKMAVEAVFKAGIIPVGFFMIGFPTETEESVLNTYNFAKELKLIRYRFGIFYPYRGTHDNSIELKWLEKEERTFDKSNHEHQVVKCKMEDHKVENYFREFNKNIYFEPGYKDRLKEFISAHKDMQLTIKEWADYLNIKLEDNVNGF